MPDTKYEYFIAARYRNKENVLDLVHKLRTKGRTLYCFIESEASRKHVAELNEDAEAGMQQFEAITDWNTDERVTEVFNSDMDALKASRTVILLLPAGKSAHMEAGVAYGLGKKLVMIGQPERNETLYRMFDEYFDDIDTFIGSL